MYIVYRKSYNRVKSTERAGAGLRGPYVVPLMIGNCHRSTVEI